MPKRMTQEDFENRVKEYTKDSVKVISPYINKRTKVQVQCKKCNAIWDFSPTTIMPNNMKKSTFVGCNNCLYIDLVCDECKKPFRRLRSESNGNLHFCSKECGNRYKNNTIKKITNGLAYRRNAFDAYPHCCAICGYNEETDILEVHHIDENRQNNNIHNLIILCPNCHKKITLHKYELIGRNTLKKIASQEILDL